MRDKYGREINYLRVSVTDRCNLRCIYCLPEQGVELKPHADILSYEELEEVISCVVELGVTRIRITGGEPLVRKGILQFIEKVRSMNVAEVSLTTNGLLLGKLAEDLKSAGVSRVNVSLDTLKPERFRMITRFGELKDVLNGIEKALECGLSPVKLNSVIMRGINEDEIEDLAKLTLHSPIHVRFIELMPLSEGAKLAPSLYVPEAVIRERIANLGKVESLVSPIQGCGPAKYYKLNGAKGTIGFISPLSHEFCEQCNRLRLTADGKVSPCLASNQEVDLKPALRSKFSKERLRELVMLAVEAKPRRHEMNAEARGGQLRVMSRIGG